MRSHPLPTRGELASEGWRGFAAALGLALLVHAALGSVPGPRASEGRPSLALLPTVELALEAPARLRPPLRTRHHPAPVSAKRTRGPSATPRRQSRAVQGRNRLPVHAHQSSAPRTAGGTLGKRQPALSAAPHRAPAPTLAAAPPLIPTGNALRPDFVPSPPAPETPAPVAVGASGVAGSKGTAGSGSPSGGGASGTGGSGGGGAGGPGEGSGKGAGGGSGGSGSGAGLERTVPAPRPAAPASSRPDSTRVAVPAPPPERPAIPPPPPPVPEEPLTQPRYRSNPPPAYPREARRLRREGTVLLRVVVNTSGGVDQVEVEASSGTPALDEAACIAVARWRFEPGRRGDTPVACRVTVPVRFRLD